MGDPGVLHSQLYMHGSPCLLILCEGLPTPISGVLQRCIKNKDNMHSRASTQRPRRTNDSPSRGLRHPFCPSPGWTFSSLPLGLLLKEVMILLLLQFTVILLNFTVGFFHVVIHELVHEWVKISLVTKEVDKLGAIIKVTCR